MLFPDKYWPKSPLSAALLGPDEARATAATAAPHRALARNDCITFPPQTTIIGYMLPGGWKVHKTFAWRNARNYCVVSEADFQFRAGEVHNPERTILPIATILQQKGEVIAKGSIPGMTG
jgi:hypothetical protein